MDDLKKKKKELLTKIRKFDFQKSLKSKKHNLTASIYVYPND